ncbi:hypothetical protein PHSY_001446 [Pseudozyma hubeiensis SY62]|uniref:Uncharacterized protein n=1 Tax=Pseudozyma hubeiensis (strain SY62) TaxID=1305764 RepID=R9NYT1_PSEHS|nr:hypothetical protein PHSY_001446 [Pseudozyma hubeiensis SY62]GAC93879.1 hypothetical protein PHSY_001446 [Pseudozyma hubeiensis SY62]
MLHDESRQPTCDLVFSQQRVAGHKSHVGYAESDSPGSASRYHILTLSQNGARVSSFRGTKSSTEVFRHGTAATGSGRHKRWNEATMIDNKLDMNRTSVLGSSGSSSQLINVL